MCNFEFCFFFKNVFLFPNSQNMKSTVTMLLVLRKMFSSFTEGTLMIVGTSALGNAYNSKSLERIWDRQKKERKKLNESRGWNRVEQRKKERGRKEKKGNYLCLHPKRLNHTLEHPKIHAHCVSVLIRCQESMKVEEFVTDESNRSIL